MKTQWIKADPKEPIEEHEMPDSFFFNDQRAEVNKFLGGEFEFVQVLYENKPRYMLVNEIGAMIPLPRNIRATDIYHNAMRARGKDWPIDSPPFIHGDVILVEEQMT